jgi:hypothetical protein
MKYLLSVAVVALMLFAVYYFVTIYKHLPSKPIDAELRAKIKKYGLKHFTDTKEHAESIRINGLSPRPEKALFCREKDFVWLYTSEPDRYKENLAEIRTKGKRANVGYVVYFQEIADEEIEKMYYKNNTVVYKGNFKPKKIYISKV